MAIPVTLEEARRQIRLEDDDESRDVDLGNYIDDAAAWVEQYTGHLFDRRRVSQSACGNATVHLRAWPIAPDADLTVTYTDAGGRTISATGGCLDTRRRPARFIPPGTGLPFHDLRYTYEVTVLAGHANPAGVPRNLKRAMLVLIAAYDADREGGELLKTAIKTAESLCQRFRVRRL